MLLHWTAQRTFNIPDINWDTYSGSSALADDFAEFAYNHNLVQHVVGPTHIAGNILDLALSNAKSLYHFDTYSTLPSRLSSDHQIVLLIDHSPIRPTRVQKQKFDFANFCWEDLNEFFTQYDFNLVLNSNITEFIWLYLKTAINSALTLFVPKIPLKESNQPKWYNSIIRHKIKCLQKTAK